MKNGIRGVASESQDGVSPIEDADDYAGCIIHDVMTSREDPTDIALRLDHCLIQFQPEMHSTIVRTSGLKRLKQAKLLGIDHLLEDTGEVQEIIVQTDKGWMRMKCCSLLRGVPVRIGINHLGEGYIKSYKAMKQDRGVT